MNALRKLIHHVFGFTPESRSKANADKAANLPVCDADKIGKFAPLTSDQDANWRFAPDLEQAANLPLGPDKASGQLAACSNADQAAFVPFAPDADKTGTNAGLNPDADNPANLPGFEDRRADQGANWPFEPDKAKGPIGPFIPDADKPAQMPVCDKRARNLAKLEARKVEAAAKHRATMATKPGARS